jgi:uncharacterized protein (DUF2147 family)
MNDSYGLCSDDERRKLFVQKPLIYESIKLSRCARRRPIRRSGKVLFALLAGLLLVGGLHTTAYADGTDEEDEVNANVDRILGYWQRGEGEAIIEVRRKAEGYHGVVVTSGKRPETVGIEVFRELRYDAKEGAWHGRAYSIKRKREVRIDIEVPSADELKLTAHILIFSRRVQFKRVPDEDVAGRPLADR